MRDTMTISLPSPMKDKLDRLCNQEGLSRSDLVRSALRQYFAAMEFQRLRKTLVVTAAERGLFTDDDIFQRIS